MMPSPCTPDCPDRRAGTRTTPPCHSYCERYAAFRVERDAQTAARERDRVMVRYAARSKAQHAAIVMQDAKRRRERTRR